MRLDTQEISMLLGSLYDAAANPNQWTPFLRSLAQATRAQSAGLVLRDEERNFHTISHSWEMDPELCRLYERHYHSVDVWAQRGRSYATGAVLASESLCPLAELRSTEVYNDLMVPSHIEHGLFAMVQSDGVSLNSVSLFRPPSLPEFGVRELEFLQFLSPHLERAFKLYLQFSEMKAASAGFETALDMLSTGLIFFGTKGNVVLMNRSAMACVAERDGLLATREALRAERSAESALLEKTISQAASALNGNALSAGGTVMISRRSRPPLQIQISPIRNSVIQTSQPIAAVAFVNDSLRQHRPTQEVLRVLFGLTPAECRVALLLGDGHAPRKIANMVGVTDSTVRSQIKSIFSKTGVRRQGELIRLLLNNSGSSMNPNASQVTASGRPSRRQTGVSG